MSRRKGRRFLLYLLIIVLAIFFIKVSLVPRLPTIGKTTDKKVYVALGFHTNLYHSYRNDTNTEAGFGKDIRIIKGIIKTLNEHNAAGSKVHAVWDFDNLFTLQEILPAYAPDIITDIKKRVAEGNDEVILMSYNNGLTSAMTQDELIESITSAVTNPKGSGVSDLFSDFTPIVRPQEGMTSTGSFGLYKKLGIEGVVLYYSAIPFDNFRVFLPTLSVEEALNPLTYKNKETGESMTVIPAYNVGDLIENVSLTKWARDIHRKQIEGTIKNDVLIFVNFDADDSYWSGYKLPLYLKWLPNTGGLRQLIDEADALNYVEFTTLKDYLKTHPPKKEIFFGQDTADGNFDGYNPWAEKTSSHDYWTSLLEDRRNHKAVELSYRAIDGREYTIRKPAPSSKPVILDNIIPKEEQDLLAHSKELRMRLLSTTNFGMATPLLCSDREFAVEKIIDEMLKASRTARDTAHLAIQEKLGRITPPKNPGHGMKFIDSFLVLSDPDAATKHDFAFVSFDVAGLNVPDEGFYILSPGGKITIPYVINSNLSPDGTVAMLKLFFSPDEGSGPYFLFSGPKAIFPEVAFKTTAGGGILTNDTIKVEVSDKGVVKTVIFNKKRFLNEKSFMPKITYRQKDDKKTIELSPENLKVAVEKDGTTGVARIRIFGEFAIPEVKDSKPGFVDYHLTLLDGVPYLFFDGEITYPDTPKRDLMGLGKPISLLRKVDDGWEEAAPAELLMTAGANKKNPFTIIKRDYLGAESSYTLNYFNNSDKNLNLANVNNHITAEYAAITGGGSGIAVALNNIVRSNFAFLPMKVLYAPDKQLFAAKLNPFGTYFGPQYENPTWGTHLGYEAASLSGESYRSSAPSYNNYRERFSLMISFFDGGSIPDEIKNDLISYADPPILVSGGKMQVIEKVADENAPAAPEGILAASEDSKLHIIWNKAGGNPQSYKVYIGTSSGNYTNVYETKDTNLALPQPAPGKTYYISVAAVFAGGKEMGPEEEITFVPGKDVYTTKGIELPLSLQLRILWYGLLSYID